MRTHTVHVEFNFKSTESVAIVMLTYACLAFLQVSDSLKIPFEILGKETNTYFLLESGKRIDHSA